MQRPDSIYVERGGKLTKDPITFVDEAHQAHHRQDRRAGWRGSTSRPRCVRPPPDGPAERHHLSADHRGAVSHHPQIQADPLQVDDLIRRHVDANAARFYSGVVGRFTMTVSGGTGTGKTTTSMSCHRSSPPANVTVEDAKELQLHQDHVLCMDSTAQH